MSWNDDVRPLQATARGSQASEHCNTDCKGRIGHDAKRSTWQSEVGSVGLHDDHTIVGERLSKFLSTGRMKFEGNHPSTSTQQWSRYRAGSGSNIEHDVTGANPRAVNETFGPRASEAMPSPSCELPGHGGPS
jgi:hypothetical protein